MSGVVCRPGHVQLRLLAVLAQAALGAHCRLDLLETHRTPQELAHTCPVRHRHLHDLLRHIYQTATRRPRGKLYNQTNTPKYIYIHALKIVTNSCFCFCCFYAIAIYILTSIFFMFTFLAATQDIVVDGWALTMLSK